MTDPDGIDLGHGHRLTWVAFDPSWSTHPLADRLPPVDRYAAMIHHDTPDGRPCVGVILLDTPVARIVDTHRPMWTIDAWDPLTVSPSVRCGCGDQGWISSGHWWPAGP